MTQPPLGTKCSDCGSCYADIAIGDGSALCWECDAGEPCKGRCNVLSGPEASPFNFEPDVSQADLAPAPEQ